MFVSGDHVRNRPADLKGSVLYGPYAAAEALGPEDVYLVKLLEGPHAGKAVQWPVSWVEASPRFEVGQVVRSSNILHKVVAGPFTRGTGSRFYVLEGPDGSQDTEYEAYMVPVVE